MTDRETREQMSRRARVIAQENTWQNVARQYIEIIEMVVAERRR
ncbi:MAG: glycosyltransferase [Acidiferrobacterales bacterium]